jgi:hypothetical protein
MNHPYTWDLGCNIMDQWWGFVWIPIWGLSTCIQDFNTKTYQIFYWALNTDILQECVLVITRTRSNKVDEELQKRKSDKRLTRSVR